MQRRPFVAVVCVAVASLAIMVQASHQVDGPLDPSDGQRLLDKLVQIAERDGTQTRAFEPVVIHQREVNAYLRFQAAAEIPASVTDPDVALRNGGAVSVQAIVDLSELRDSRPRGPLDPLRYLGGRVLVAASGLVRTQNGIGHVIVESVTLGGVSMPASVLAELVRYYARSEQNPDGIDVTEPFDLPYGVTELRVERERVVVVQ